MAEERQPLAQEVPTQEIPQKPNILLVLTDDQDVDSLSEMPNVRSLLADRGTIFSQYFVTTALCCPSRASILRSQYTHNHGVWSTAYPVGGFERFRELGYEYSTVATWLDGAGYVTGYMGKYLNEYGSYSKPTTHIPPGWDRWIGYQGGYNAQKVNSSFKVNNQGEIDTIDTETLHDTDYFARKAEAFIRNRKANTPWFLVVSTNAAHAPFLASKRNDGAYTGRTMPRTPNFNEADVSDKASVWQKKPLLTDECPSDYQTQRYLQCIPEADELWRDRMESLQDVDEMVVRLDRALGDKGFMENTYVIYPSDNGWGMYKNRIYSKGAPYERSQGVPFIVRGPGVTPGYVDERLVANIDLAPTFAEWAGAQTPDFLDGRSFAPLLGDPAKLAPWRTRLLFEWRISSNEYRVVRTHSGQVYVEYPRTGEAEYYDLTTDPYQLDGKAQTPPPELKMPLEDLANCSGEGCRAADRDCSADLMDNDGDGVVDEPGEPCGDPHRPPDTAMDARPDDLTNSTSATFTFYSSKVGSTFECSVDGTDSTACNPEDNALNSKTYHNLGDAEHTFSVRATDQAGDTDRTPASYTWTVDTAKPTVTSVTPAEGAKDVSPSTNVHAFFSEAMNRDTITVETFRLARRDADGTTTPVEAAVAYNATSKKAVLNPANDLQPGATYIATVTTGMKDAAGNRLDQNQDLLGNQRKAWRFTVR
jgi:N-acetylglucosamine-6-sulfatase